MTYYKTAGVIFNVCFFIVCKTGFAQQPDSVSAYFPLQIGNQWNYGTFTRTIVGTKQIRNHLYYEMNTSFGPSGEYPTWFRMSNDTVYVIGWATDTTESPLYNLNADIGDSITLASEYECSYGKAIIMSSKSDSVSTPSGTYFHCYRFVHIGAQCPDAGMTESWLAKGIGTIKLITESIGGPITAVLTSYSSGAAVGSAAIHASHPQLFLDGHRTIHTTQVVLTYQIPVDSRVTLKIINARGETVSLLVCGQLKAGNYRASWNTSNLPGNAYIAVLRAGNCVKAKYLICY